MDPCHNIIITIIVLSLLLYYHYYCIIIIIGSSLFYHFIIIMWISYFYITLKNLLLKLKHTRDACMLSSIYMRAVYKELIKSDKKCEKLGKSEMYLSS